MVKQKKMGKIPVNARITIDYSKKKPTIKFGYPRKDIVHQHRFGIPFLFLLLIWTICYVLFMYNIDIMFGGTEINAPQDCNFSHYNVTEYELDRINAIFIDCDNYNYTLQFSKGMIYDNFLLTLINNKIQYNYPKWINYNSNNEQIQDLFYVFLFMFCLFGGSMLLILQLDKLLVTYLVKQKWYQKSFPEWNKTLSGRGYEATFKKVPDNKIIEIPLFKNIYLDYKATKQFSKYLERVEIKEHPFDRVHKKKGKKTTRKRNIVLWYAKFYFSEVPKSGKLEVFFK